MKPKPSTDPSPAASHNYPKHRRPVEREVPAPEWPDAETPSGKYRIGEAARRAQLLNEWATLQTQGYTKNGAAKHLRTSVPSLWRWQKQFAANGLLGLLPTTDKCGRKPETERPPGCNAR